MTNKKEKYLLGDDFKKSVNTSYELMNHAWKCISEDMQFLNKNDITKTHEEMLFAFEDLNAKLDSFACVCNNLRYSLNVALSQAQEMNACYALEC